VDDARDVIGLPGHLNPKDLIEKRVNQLFSYEDQRESGHHNNPHQNPGGNDMLIDHRVI